MTDHPCPSCGKVFDSRRGVAVHHWRSHDERLPNRTCEHCGDDFYSEHEKRYCSELCRDAGVSFEGENNPNYDDRRETGTCGICGDEFEYYPSEKAGRYCPSCVSEESWQDTPTVAGSDNPHWGGGKQTVDCVICGETVERWPSEATGITVCSDTCRREWLSEAFSGADHPNWKGGGNIKYGPGWSRTRRRALERDDHTCQHCGTTAAEIGRNPDVHHLVPVRWFVDAADYSLADAHSLDNVISLCPRCHRKAEFGSIPVEELCAEIEVDPADLAR